MRGPTEVGVRTMGRVEDVAEFNDIIVKNVGGAPIRIRDVGYVEDGMAERRTFAYYQGQARGHSGSPPPDRHQHGQGRRGRSEAKLDACEASCLRGVKIDVVKEQATYIKNSVKALEEHLVLGSLLASLIVWLFIRDWRTVLISSIAIPTSIITTFTLMRLMDFTLNSMTLLGLTLAVGIVIDDAIIVLENIYRFIEEKGMPPMQAAVEATKEIALAVMATTLSLVIIFVPIAFMTGYAQAFMNQFGWTMAISILVSMLVAFTLTPRSARACSRRREAKNRQARRTDTGAVVERVYVGAARVVAAHRWVDRRDLRADLRLHVRHQPLHRARLDAAGGPERAAVMCWKCRKARRSKPPRSSRFEHRAEDREDSGRDRGGPAKLDALHGPRDHGISPSC